jgi:hypothetical protein
VIGPVDVCCTVWRPSASIRDDDLLTGDAGARRRTAIRLLAAVCNAFDELGDTSAYRLVVAQEQVSAMVERHQAGIPDSRCGEFGVAVGGHCVVTGVDDQGRDAYLLKRVALHVWVGDVEVVQHPALAWGDGEQACPGVLDLFPL